MNEWKTQCWQKWTHATHAQGVARETDAIPCHVTNTSFQPVCQLEGQWRLRYSNKTGKNEPKNRQRIFGVWLYSLRSTAVVLLPSPIHQLSQGPHSMAVLRCYTHRFPEGFFYGVNVKMKYLKIKKKLNNNVRRSLATRLYYFRESLLESVDR